MTSENQVPGGPERNDPAPAAADRHRRPKAALIAGLAALLVIVAVIVVVIAVDGGGGGDKKAGASDTDTPGPARSLTAAEMAKLPKTSTFTTVPGALLDDSPFTIPDGTVVHPLKAVPIYATAGGEPIAVLPATEFTTPTWVPVVARKPGWVRVLLPSRPNRSTGWIPTGAGLKIAKSPYLIRVRSESRQVTVLKDNRVVAEWTVAVGTAKNPTPLGRTFMLAMLAPAHPTYSRLLFPLGTHSDVLETFGGGPGTVAFHTWPDAKVYGRAVTHGCVRVPNNALDALSRVPTGSPVIVT